MDILLLSSSIHEESFANFLENLFEQQTEEAELITRILEIIEHVARNGGHPQPPYAKPLREVNNELCELRIKYENNLLLRIYYFVEKGTQKLFLLNYILKPDQYEKTVKKKTDKIIEKSIQLALQLKNLPYSSYEPF